MCPLTKFEGGLNLLHEAVAGVYSDSSTREINNKTVLYRNGWMDPAVFWQEG